MKSEEFVYSLQRSGMTVFSSTDAALILGKDTKYTALFLRRLVDKGRVARVERGKYYISGASIYAVASNILYPSYVSLMGAFRFHNITTQNVATIDVISPKAHPSIDNLEGNAVNFIKFVGRRLFGFYRDKETGAFVAHVEKAIVDSLYLNNPPFSYVVEALKAAIDDEKIDIERLNQFALRMESVVLLKRLQDASKAAGVGYE